ncbi:MAG: hypothetical protein NC082_01225 [Clostridiales bacterium]|nr:hypothetical protein [Clostridiales bacterium]
MLSLDIVPANPVANLDRVSSVMERHKGEMDLLLLPELFSTAFGRDIELLRDISGKNDTLTMARLIELSNEYNTAIAGSYLACEAGRYYNRGFFISPGDNTPIYYDKRHLFSISAEGVLFTAGEKPIPVISYKGWNLALAVCYDLRFPAWVRFSLKEKPYDALLIAANWPISRMYAWEHLLIARAIENQAYVLACDRSGNDDFGNYDEMTRAYDYRGHHLDATSMGDDLLVATLNHDLLNEWRHRWPFIFDADSIIVR